MNLFMKYNKLILCLTLFLLLPFFSLFSQKIIVKDKYIKEGIHKILKEANNGNPESQYIIGRHCFRGEMIQKDSIIGLKYIELAAKQDYVPAFQELGIYWLRQGKIELAESYLKKALERFDVNNKYLDKESITTRLFNIAAYDIIGDEELSYSNIIKYMDDKALSRYEYLSNYDADATELLMEYYGVQRNHPKTIFYGLKCYEKGIPTSGFWLGQIYEYGLGKPKDLNKAITYYEFGANSEDDDVNQTCRDRLSEICYNSNMMDKAFKYSYDYAHNEVDNDSGTADILHRLASCYRFGRGVKQNIELGDIWDALGIWFCEFDTKAETIAEFEDFDPDNDTQLFNYILKKIYYKIPQNKVLSSNATLLTAFYWSFVEQKWEKFLPLLIKSYRLPDAMTEGQALSVYFLNKLYEEVPALKTDEGLNIIKDFLKKESIEITDLDEPHVLDNCFYKVFVEQIKEFE